MKGRAWTDVEDAIINEHRANGRVAIKAALRLAGFDRSLDQIKGRIATIKRTRT